MVQKSCEMTNEFRTSLVCDLGSNCSSCMLVLVPEVASELTYVVVKFQGFGRSSRMVLGLEDV